MLEQVIVALSGQATGLDINAFALSHIHRAKTIQADAEAALPISSDSFDVVVALHVIEHLNDSDAFFNEVQRILAGGGCLLLAFPAEPFRGAYAVWSSMKIFHHPFAVRRIHVRKYRPRDLAQIAARSGLQMTWSTFSLRPWPQYFAVFQSR
jgi:SAM-dependent methyltransferase